jgi:tetratricopeptide (TPR) repeat protein
MNETTRNTAFWFITLSIPFLLFLGVEIALRIGGYEQEKQELFVEAPNTPDYLIANSTFIERYFPSFVPEIAPNAFRKEKLPNTFRIFVFGGSSAEGFPYNFYTGFADQLEQQLLLNTQGLPIEVINLGMTAVNSYVIRDLSKRVLPYEPDAVIIYAGHNEYYGSFGAATTQFGFSNSIGLKRLILWLKDWRIYQFLENTLQIGGTNQDTGERRTMMAKVISESDIPVDSDIYRHGIQQYRSNMSSLVKRFDNNGVPVFLGTVASNLKDQAPLSDNPEVLALYEQAQATYEEGLVDEAFTLFLQAKELDGTRFRAPEEMNRILATITQETSAELVPIQAVLRNASTSKIEDSSLFIDHLHPNDRGHKIMANTFFEAISSLPNLQNYLNPNPIGTPSEISTFEKAFAQVSIARLLVGYPFEKNIPIDEELQAFERIYRSYLNTSYIDSIAAVASKQQVFVPLALTEVVAQARKRKDTLAVVQHSYDLLKWQLRSRNLIETSIEFTLNSGEDQAYLINMLHQIINDGNLDPRYVDLLASLYLLDEQTKQALYWLQETERMTPNAPRLFYNYSRYYLLEGDTLKAQEYFQQFVQSQRRD